MKAARLTVATRGPRDERVEVSPSGRPILLATMDVPFDERASTFAVDTAVESGDPLVIANVIDLEPLACSQVMGYNHLESPELTESLHRPAEVATSLGVRVERLRVKSFRPIQALLQVVGERRPGMLVFGPDRSHLSPRRYRKASEAVRADVACLVWLPG